MLRIRCRATVWVAVLALACSGFQPSWALLGIDPSQEIYFQAGDRLFHLDLSDFRDPADAPLESAGGATIVLREARSSRPTKRASGGLDDTELRSFRLLDAPPTRLSDGSRIRQWEHRADLTIEALPDGVRSRVVAGFDTLETRVQVDDVQAEEPEVVGLTLTLNDATASFDGAEHRQLLEATAASLEPAGAIAAKLRSVGARAHDGVALGRWQLAVQRALSEAAALTPLEDCTQPCFFCGYYSFIGAGIAMIAAPSCITVVGCLAAGGAAAGLFGTAVQSCVACDRCLHAPTLPSCEPGFVPCSPTSYHCCPVPSCPDGFEPCERDCCLIDCLPGQEPICP